MATYKQGIDGPVMGKIGQHVGSKWRNIYYLRSLASAVSNPRTLKQRKVRARFSTLVKLASVFKSAFDTGFAKNSLSGVMTQGNIFVRKNWECVTATSPDDVSVDYSSLMVADGNLTGVVFGAVDYGEAHHLTISATFNGNVGADGADANYDVYLFAYCPDMGRSVLSTPAKRSTGSVSLTVPNLWDGQEVYLYGFTAAGDSNVRYIAGTCSKSSYCGTGEVQ